MGCAAVGDLEGTDEVVLIETDAGDEDYKGALYKSEPYKPERGASRPIVSPDNTTQWLLMLSGQGGSPLAKRPVQV